MIKKEKPKKNGRPTKHEVRYRNVGRRSVMDESTLAKLKEGFAKGFSIANACIWANISQDAYYDYARKNPDFSEQCKALQQQPLIKSILVINDALEGGDVSTAKWYAERKAKDEFSLKTETEHSGKVESRVVYIEKEEKETYENHIDQIVDGD